MKSRAASFAFGTRIVPLVHTTFATWTRIIYLLYPMIKADRKSSHLGLFSRTAPKTATTHGKEPRPLGWLHVARTLARTAHAHRADHNER